MESRWIYGVHVESMWNLWGRVKYRWGRSMIWGEVKLSLLSACWVLRLFEAFISEVTILLCELFRACNVFE